MQMKSDYPVSSFPMKYSWQEGDWEKLFDEQIKLIKEDIYRAKVQGRMIIYLSCPISSRGGGYSGTNVEITEFTRMRLLKEWGTGFWILNPASYQMESKAGTGLMNRHAQNIWGAEGETRLNELVKNSPAADGDYMRMWTKVLVEDNEAELRKNLGYNFDGFYFLGPTDVKAYFLNSDDGDMTSSINNYFARKYASDADFRDYYTVNGIHWGGHSKETPRPEAESKLILEWEKKRKDFFRFYSLKAGMNYSLGGHDEWNIWNLLNELRVQKLDRRTAVGEIIPGFFEGKQITPGDFTVKTITGYETK
jgi:hypothetical protein